MASSKFPPPCLPGGGTGPNFDRLSYFHIQAVLGFLDAAALLRAEATCRAFAGCAAANTHWEALLARDWGVRATRYWRYRRYCPCARGHHYRRRWHGRPAHAP